MEFHVTVRLAPSSSQTPTAVTLMQPQADVRALPLNSSDARQLCATLQVRALAADFKSEMGRHYYTTPTSYLELIQTYKELLASKRKQVQGLKRRYEVGLEKLLAAESDVGAMKEELIALQPQLEESTRQTEAAMEVGAGSAAGTRPRHV